MAIAASAAVELSSFVLCVVLCASARHYGSQFIVHLPGRQQQHSVCPAKWLGLVATFSQNVLSFSSLFWELAVFTFFYNDYTTIYDHHHRHQWAQLASFACCRNYCWYYCFSIIVILILPIVSSNYLYGSFCCCCSFACKRFTLNWLSESQYCPKIGRYSLLFPFPFLITSGPLLGKWPTALHLNFSLLCLMISLNWRVCLCLGVCLCYL